MHLRETGLPRAPHEAIVREAIAASDRFRPRRLEQARGWHGLDLVAGGRPTEDAALCPTLMDWLARSVPWIPNRAYIARLDPGGEVFWHRDFSDPSIFSTGFLLALRIPPGSFVEFEGGARYVYEDGAGYFARLGVSHRASNPTREPRFTAFIGSAVR